MDDHVGIVDVDFQIREGIEDVSAQVRRQFHGILGIVLPTPPTGHLEGEVLFVIGLVDEVDDPLRKILVAIIGKQHYRADLYETEDRFHGIEGIFIVEVPFRLHVDAAVRTGDFELAIHPFQGPLHVPHQCLFKEVAVLALDADFAVFQ